MKPDRSFILMALLAVVESLQLLVIVIFVFSFFPIPWTDFAKDFFPNEQTAVKPNHNMLFLHIWVLAVFFIYGGGLWIFRGRLGAPKTDALLLRLMAVDGGWLFLQLFAVFKMILYPQYAWPKISFYLFLGISVLSRIFWIEIDAFLLKAGERWPRWSSQWPLKWLIAVGTVIFMAAGLWIVDPARLWALIDLAGNRGLAYEGWKAFSPLVHGANYASVIGLLVVLSIVYYIFFYFLLYRLFGSVLLAGCGMLLAVKWQYFHVGIAPVIWQFPLKSILPLFPDVFFWLALAFHVGLAAVILGIYLAYHFQTAVWLWIAFAVYLTLNKGQRAWGLLPLFMCLGIWLLVLGVDGSQAVITQYGSAFWQVMQGKGSLPYYDCLRDRQFFIFWAQFLIPVIYFATIIKAPKNNLIIPVSVYGLGLFTLHVWQPTPSHYDSVSAPLVIVLCFWATLVLQKLSTANRIIALSVALILYAGALMTNNLFGIYPNRWNMSGVNWQQVITADQRHP